MVVVVVRGGGSRVALATPQQLQGAGVQRGSREGYVCLWTPLLGWTVVPAAALLLASTEVWRRQHPWRAPQLSLTSLRAGVPA